MGIKSIFEIAESFLAGGASVALRAFSGGPTADDLARLAMEMADGSEGAARRLEEIAVSESPFAGAARRILDSRKDLELLLGMDEPEKFMARVNGKFMMGSGGTIMEPGATSYRADGELGGAYIRDFALGPLWAARLIYSRRFANKDDSLLGGSDVHSGFFSHGILDLFIRSFDRADPPAGPDDFRASPIPGSGLPKQPPGRLPRELMLRGRMEGLYERSSGAFRTLAHFSAAAVRGDAGALEALRWLAGSDAALAGTAARVIEHLEIMRRVALAPDPAEWNSRALDLYRRAAVEMAAGIASGGDASEQARTRAMEMARGPFAAIKLLYDRMGFDRSDMEANLAGTQIAMYAMLENTAQDPSLTSEEALREWLGSTSFLHSFFAVASLNSRAVGALGAELFEAQRAGIGVEFDIPSSLGFKDAESASRLDAPLRSIVRSAIAADKKLSGDRTIKIGWVKFGEAGGIEVVASTGRIPDLSSVELPKEWRLIYRSGSVIIVPPPGSITEKKADAEGARAYRGTSLSRRMAQAAPEDAPAEALAAGGQAAYGPADATISIASGLALAGAAGVAWALDHIIPGPLIEFIKHFLPEAAPARRADAIETGDEATKPPKAPGGSNSGGSAGPAAEGGGAGSGAAPVPSSGAAASGQAGGGVIVAGVSGVSLHHRAHVEGKKRPGVAVRLARERAAHRDGTDGPFENSAAVFVGGAVVAPPIPAVVP
ncbi:MAG: hypothetical protein V2A66_05800 [Pseudomonadota bacterium]